MRILFIIFPKQVTQTFYINISPVDDSLPIVTNFGVRVQEGVRKTLTEFELKAQDADTPVSINPLTETHFGDNLIFC